MKLVICTNHSYEHTGGTETVIQQIADGLAEKYDYDSIILSRSLKQDRIVHNKTTLIKCAPDSSKFLKQLESLKPDRIFVYSDCFAFWQTILENIERLPSKYSISLVGMNNTISNRKLMSLFRTKYKLFQVITHSDNYQDYITCRDAHIPVNVVPNGVDASEFSHKLFSFRDKYNIKTKYIILCVSNFFPGKGQEYLLPVLEELYKKLPEFTAVFICSTVNFYVANNIRDRYKVQLRRAKFPSKLFSDIPREDVVSAFLDADVFAFPSQKEVAPLVILESMISKTPWVALPVGNIPSLKGGRMVPFRAKNHEGYALFGAETHEHFVKCLFDILLDEKIRSELKTEGYEYVSKNLIWDNIIPIYHRLFSE